MEIKDIMELGIDEETSKKIFDIHKKELNNALVNFDVDTALIKAGAKNIRAARALMDFEAAKKGNINSQIDKLLKEKDSSFLFEKNIIKGAAPQEAQETTPKDLKKMTYTEMCQIMNNENI